MKRRVRLATSAACGMLAMLLAAAAADSARAEVRSERAEVLERYGGEVTQLVVARRELPAGSVLAESDLEMREWLADLAPAKAVTSFDDVVGVRLAASVSAGEPLTELDVTAAEGAVEVPEGRVAVSVKIGDKSGVAADTPAGSRVLAYVSSASGVKLVSADVVVLGTFRCVRLWRDGRACNPCGRSRACHDDSLRRRRWQPAPGAPCRRRGV